jgi:hypothetical protein
MKNSNTLSGAEAERELNLKYQNLYQSTSILVLVLQPEPAAPTKRLQPSQRPERSINISSRNEVATGEIIRIQSRPDEIALFRPPTCTAPGGFRSPIAASD